MENDSMYVIAIAVVLVVIAIVATRMESNKAAFRNMEWAAWRREAERIAIRNKSTLWSHNDPRRSQAGEAAKHCNPSQAASVCDGAFATLG